MQTSSSKEVTVLGIDPGSISMGFGLIARSGSSVRLVDCGVVRPQKGADLPHRLSEIHEFVLGLIQKWNPAAVAIESLFYAKNVRSALVLAHARGTVLAAAARAHVPVAEYSPMEVKKATVGYGRATKEQVQLMLNHLFPAQRIQNRIPHDATDALSIALCHVHSAKILSFEQAPTTPRAPGRTQVRWSR